MFLTSPVELLKLLYFSSYWWRLRPPSRHVGHPVADPLRGVGTFRVPVPLTIRFGPRNFKARRVLHRASAGTRMGICFRVDVRTRKSQLTTGMQVHRIYL
jgi:hypothetical protein